MERLSQLMSGDSDNPLDDLQRIEAGLVGEMTPALTYLVGHTKMSGKKPAEKACMLCGADLMILHHIMSYEKQREYNGDSAGFDGVIGYVWICPNCHHRIHNENPYFIAQKNRRPKY